MKNSPILSPLRFVDYSRMIDVLQTLNPNVAFNLTIERSGNKAIATYQVQINGGQNKLQRKYMCIANDKEFADIQNCVTQFTKGI